jgi:hypothetical protein
VDESLALSVLKRVVLQVAQVFVAKRRVRKMLQEEVSQFEPA